MKDGHEDTAGAGSGLGLGAEADFTSNDGGTKISLGEVIVCRNLSIIGPSIEALLIFMEDFLDATNRQMLDGIVDRF